MAEKSEAKLVGVAAAMESDPRSDLRTETPPRTPAPLGRGGISTSALSGTLDLLNSIAGARREPEDTPTAEIQRLRVENEELRQLLDAMRPVLQEKLNGQRAKRPRPKPVHDGFVVFEVDGFAQLTPEQKLWPVVSLSSKPRPAIQAPPKE